MARVRVSVKFTAKERRSFKRQAKAFAKRLGSDIETALDIIALAIADEAKQILTSQKVSDTGLTRASINVKESPGSRRIGANTGYSLFIEIGRGPGKPPPVSALVPWVRRNITSDQKEAESIAYLIARAIGQRGIKARPFLRPAFDRAKKKLLLEIRKQYIK